MTIGNAIFATRVFFLKHCFKSLRLPIFSRRYWNIRHRKEDHMLDKIITIQPNNSTRHNQPHSYTELMLGNWTFNGGKVYSNKRCYFDIQRKNACF